MFQTGDRVIYEGRPHVLVGITPMSVTPFEMCLQDEASGRTFWVEGQPRQRPDGLYEVLRDVALRAAEESEKNPKTS
jgi:hypothetical protein